MGAREWPLVLVCAVVSVVNSRAPRAQERVAPTARAPTGESWACRVIDASSRGADGVKLGDVDGDGRLDITTGWEEGGITRVYLHPGPARVREPWPAVTVGETPAVEDAVFFEPARDSLAVVSSCEGRARRIEFHWAPVDRTRLLKPEAWKQETLPASRDLMQWMFAWPMDVDGRAGLDLVAGGKGSGAAIGWFEAPDAPRDLAGYRWHAMSAAGWIMSIWKRDMDGDGDEDVVITDRRGDLRGARWLENPGRGADDDQAGPWTSHWLGTRESYRDTEVMSMTLADLDGDGLEDALVAEKAHRVLYLRRLDTSGRRWERIEIPADFHAGNTRAVAVADVNLDGRLDIVLTTWIAAGKHGAFWLERDRDASTSAVQKIADATWSPRVISGVERGIKYDRIELVDLDADGDLDLLTCEEQEGGGGIGVFWYENPTR